MNRYSPFSISTGLWLVEAYLQSLKSVALCARMQSWLLCTDGQILIKCPSIKKRSLSNIEIFRNIHKKRFLKSQLKKKRYFSQNNDIFGNQYFQSYGHSTFWLKGWFFLILLWPKSQFFQSDLKITSFLSELSELWQKHDFFKVISK